MDLFQQLKASYQEAAVTMAELEFYNSALQVDVVEGSVLEGSCLAVLITPWCMNLILIAEEKPEYDQAQVGSKKIVSLPSGSYEFLYAGSEALGAYGSCSLFSPMLEFADQEAAVLTAEEVLKAVLNTENCGKTDLQLAKEAQKREQEERAENQSVVRARTKEGLSRRKFMTAAFADEP
ncbi:[NiFe]-hydrogenase assembly chaperone HybE [Neptuniibacter sp. QD48_11]|uniref:[NiFe]-hydrogenase assembly chaperone HybE n=1 Tax=unclassified Neptuniibacter TaxID=2630693 RepID=UPI0039F4D51A